MRDEDDILTVKEVSRLLRVSKTTLYQYIHDGKIPARKVGHQWRFLRSQVMQCLDPADVPRSPHNGCYEI